jgi:nucleotide-binding universal stress UspA family protein
MPRLLALLDDASLLDPVVELCTTVALGLSRGLELVYVESMPAWKAAALPFARVLAHGGAQWRPFTQQDIESGYRAQAARLRELTERIALRERMPWSVRVVRGALPGAALELRAGADLLLVACPAGIAPEPARRARSPRRPLAITVLTDDSAAGQRALQIAQQVAQALDALLTIRHGGVEAALGSSRGEGCDLFVLPGPLMRPEMLARLTRPALLVD